MNISEQAVNPGESGGGGYEDEDRNTQIFPFQKPAAAFFPGSEKRAVNRSSDRENIPSAAESPGSFLRSEAAAANLAASA